MPLRLAGVLVAALLVSACTGPVATPAPRPTATPFATTYEELLRLIPDIPDTRATTQIIDYARLRALFRVPLPPLTAGLDAVLTYMADVCPVAECTLGEAPFISGFSLNAATVMENFHKYLAFDARSVDQSVLAGMPPGALEVVKGKFDPRATDRALNTCYVSVECVGDEPLRENHQGISFYSWGDDFEVSLRNRLVPPAFDNLGRGGRIAVAEEHVRRTVETDGMRALIDAALGYVPSLGDVEEFRLLARGASDLGAYALLFSDQTQGSEILLSVFPGLLSRLSSQKKALEILQPIMQVPLRPYLAFATGTGKDDRGSYMVLVLVHAGAGAAAENVERLPRRLATTPSASTGAPWSSLIDSIEVHSEGRVLLAKLRGSIAYHPYNWFYDRDPLLLQDSMSK